MTRVDNTVDTLHGVEVPDPYRWLEDQNSAETRAWIEAEDRCTAAALEPLPRRAKISKQLSELMKVDSFGLPRERGGNYFFSKRAADQDLYVIYRREGLAGADEVLVDPHGLSADHSTSVNLMGVSRDGSLAAYAIRAGGQDEVTPHFIDTNTRKDLPDVLRRASYFGLAIEPENRGVYYSCMTPEGPRVFHHVMGSPASSDTEIFGKEYGRDKILTADLSEDGRYLVIQVIYGSGSTRTDLYYNDLAGNGGVQPVVNDTEALFFGEIEGGRIFILTNWKAPHWRIFTADMNHLSRESWKESRRELSLCLRSDPLPDGMANGTNSRFSSISAPLMFQPAFLRMTPRAANLPPGKRRKFRWIRAPMPSSRSGTNRGTKPACPCFCFTKRDLFVMARGRSG